MAKTNFGASIGHKGNSSIKASSQGMGRGTTTCKPVVAYGNGKPIPEKGAANVEPKRKPLAK